MISSPIRMSAFRIAVLTALLALCGCETTPKTAKSPGEGEMFEVKVDFTPFYRNGPQQRGGPDLSLKRNRIVKMLKRGFGFSLVEIEDGTPGYVATEDLRPSSESGFGGLGGPDGGLFTLPPEPIQSSAIVERYTVGQEPDANGLQLRPGPPPDGSFLTPDAPLPTFDPSTKPAPSPKP